MHKRNEGQITAIQHGAGPMLVLAGPGSGKTYVITHRIKHLISECKIPPNNILVLTFTKAAALEMQTRAKSLLQDCAYVQFGTFHSIFYRILLTNYQERRTLASDRERLAFVHALLGQDEMDKAEACLKEISQRKNDICGTYQMSTDEYERIYKEYEAWLSENEKLDFDDMVRVCHDKLLYDIKERQKWQERFTYILIDEFQDINPLQYETVKLLCKQDNLFVVGDDDQAIYSFRGSDPKIMKQFETEYAAKVIKLAYNYRSGKSIVEHATEFIGHNKQRFGKEIKAAKNIEGDIVVKAMTGRKDMLNYITEEVERYARLYPEKSQAILLRTNGLLKPYQCLSGIKGVNSLWNDLHAYLSFINCGQKRKDFLQIMNKPVRYISRRLLTEEEIDFRLLKNRLKDKPWMVERINKMQMQTEFAKKLDLRGQLHYVWNAMGYEAYVIDKNHGDETLQRQTGKEFAEIVAMTKLCKNYHKLEEAMAYAEKDKQSEGVSKQISVMTYHGAKGLEFDRVYLPDLNFGKVPHGRMLTVEELEEERRMFYVAVTRAKESLVLLYDQKQTDSPFLFELCGTESDDYTSSSVSINSSNSQLSRYSSKASSTFSNSASSSM